MLSCKFCMSELTSKALELRLPCRLLSNSQDMTKKIQDASISWKSESPIFTRRQASGLISSRSRTRIRNSPTVVPATNRRCLQLIANYFRNLYLFYGKRATFEILQKRISSLNQCHFGSTTQVLVSVKLRDPFVPLPLSSVFVPCIRGV